MAGQPPSVARPDDRAQQLLDAARRVMEDFGIGHTTMGAVAKEAGVSRQTVYEYFPSHDVLVAEALKRGAAQQIEAAFRAAEGRGGSVEERLTTFLAVSLDFLATSPMWSTAGKRADLAPHAALEDGVFLGAGVTAMRQVLERWFPTGDTLRVGAAAETLARTLVSHGLSPSAAPRAEVAQHLSQLVSRGLA